jgi:ATP:ADP antiporter, AAA family
LRAIKKILVDMKTGVLQLDPVGRESLLISSAVMFVLLFTYPIIRSTVTSIFLTGFGAEKTPLVWLYSIIGLSISISLYSKYQIKLSIQKLFLITTLVSSLFFYFSIYALDRGLNWWAYPLFVWKEIYIVLLIHLVLGFINTILKESEAKILYGPLGAISSVGGILGGVLTTELTYSYSSSVILMIGASILLFASFIFNQTSRKFCLASKSHNEQDKDSPLSSINDIKKFVFLLSLVVLLSQFVINLANFKFNIIFNSLVPEELEKTRRLGSIYASINVVSLCTQIFIIPLTFQFFKIRIVHNFIPIFYSVIALGGFFLGGSLLAPVAGAFILFKGLDYSLFSAAKEILYYPLAAKQKYGAKYIVDMIVYRFGKGLISLLLIFYQSNFFVNTLLAISLCAWIICLQIFHKESLNIQLKRRFI